jgi:tetratricopeptide (TPR) repeat protein
MTDSRPTQPSRLAPWLLALALIAAIFVTYSNTWEVPMILDDEATITRNPTVVVLADSWKPPLKSGLTSGGRPIVNISLALNYHFVGTEVRAYHVTNTILHCLATLTLFGLVRRTLLLPRGAPWAGGLGPTGFAGCVAGLWALHPLQTESVTYIVQRAEVIAGLFIFLTLYCFVRAVGAGSAWSRGPLPAAAAPKGSGRRLQETDTGAQAPGAGRGWMVAGWLACLAGMASKEICAVIPLAVFLYDRTFVAGTFAGAWRERRTFLVMLGATWLLLGFLVWGGGGRDGTVGFSSDMTWWKYLLTQSWAIVRYLQVSVWPAGLIFDYGVFTELRWWVVVPCSAVVLTLLGLTVVALRRWPVAGFLGFLFFAVLAPSSSFIPVITQTMTEHRMYVPLLAIVVLVVGAVARWGRRWGWPALGTVLVAAGIAAHLRNDVYATTISLWSDSYAKRPQNGRAMLNLGLGYNDLGRFDDALVVLRKAEKADPKDATIVGAIGQVLFRAGRLEQSLAELERAYSMDQKSWYVRLNLGNSLFAVGRVDEAIGHLEYAREKQPYHPDIEFNVANAYAAAGRMDEAFAHYEEALRRDPEDLPARVNYAGHLRDQGRLDEAFAQYAEGLEIHPDSYELLSNRGVAYAMRGDRERAIKDVAASVALAPEAIELRMNLLLLLTEAGRYEDALPHYEALLERQEPTPDICHAYGVALANCGRPGAAVVWLRRALELDPTMQETREILRAVEGAARKP